MYLESILSFSKTELLFPRCSSAACSDLIARALKTCEVMDPLDVAVVDMVGGVVIITSCTLREERTRPKRIKSTKRSYIDESFTDGYGSRRMRWHATVPEGSVDMCSLVMGMSSFGIQPSCIQSFLGNQSRGVTSD